VVVEKMGTTPKDFPRPVGKAVKKPLI
jgi:hypothetical protein